MKCKWCKFEFAPTSKADNQVFCPQPKKCRQLWWAYNRPVARVTVKAVRERRQRAARKTKGLVTRLAVGLAGRYLGIQRATTYGIHEGG